MKEKRLNYVSGNICVETLYKHNAFAIYVSFHLLFIVLHS